jgi:hypothetical protein
MVNVWFDNIAPSSNFDKHELLFAGLNFDVNCNQFHSRHLKNK